MAWLALELHAPESRGAIGRYHDIGDRPLRWHDRQLVTRLEDDVKKDCAIEFAKKQFYLGWLAYETAAIDERHDRPNLAQRGFNRAVDAWHAIDRLPQEQRLDLLLRRAHNLVLAKVRGNVAAERTARPAAPQIRLGRARHHLSQLAMHAYSAAAENPSAQDAYLGIATEVLFSGVMVDFAERSGSFFMPFAAAPRVEDPRKTSVGSNGQMVSAAYDSEVQRFNQLWKPGSSYHVQLKTSYHEDHEDRYDLSKVTIIYGDAHMHVESIEDGLAMAESLGTTSRTAYQTSRLDIAQTNIVEELQDGPKF